MANNTNTSARFINIDGLKPNEREMYIKEHDFEAQLAERLAEIRILNGTSSEKHENEILKKQNEINSAIKDLEDAVTSRLRNLIENSVKGNNYGGEKSLNQIANTLNAKYEILSAKLLKLIEQLNADLLNRLPTFDVFNVYKTNMLRVIDETFNVKNVYAEKDLTNVDEQQYIIKNREIFKLRDINESIGWTTATLVFNPDIAVHRELDADGNLLDEYTKDIELELFRFTPYRNMTNIPSFLIELLLINDTFAFKGRVRSTKVNSKTYIKEYDNRMATFEADYAVNMDTDYSLALEYDNVNNQIVVVLTVHARDNRVTPFITMQVSVDVIVGQNLRFDNIGQLYTGGDETTLVRDRDKLESWESGGSGGQGMTYEEEYAYINNKANEDIAQTRINLANAINNIQTNSQNNLKSELETYNRIVAYANAEYNRSTSDVDKQVQDTIDKWKGDWEDIYAEQQAHPDIPMYNYNGQPAGKAPNYENLRVMTWADLQFELAALDQKDRNKMKQDIIDSATKTRNDTINNAKKSYDEAVAGISQSIDPSIAAARQSCEDNIAAINAQRQKDLEDLKIKYNRQ